MVILTPCDFPQRSAFKLQRWTRVKEKRIRPRAVKVEVTSNGVCLDVYSYATGGPRNATREAPVRVHLLPEDWSAIAQALETAGQEYERQQAEQRERNAARRERWRQEHIR